ncbi:helix-turn-helix domain-containing protein [Enterococcus sp. JM9B]|uniref:helix-turn-helix domain-containing protein n=2 Tax=Enterococcus TaxID=1350 RepID=UPI001374CF1E|nr:helix-turn-helix domain-containing protein [Enterococcus sp. JM9B]KAF1303201.1 AraC family transcriptional regulator [Enterococcus sp. JM9B]
MRIPYRRIRRKIFSGVSWSVGSYLLVFLIPFLVVSLIWYDTSTESINKQVTLTAKNQLLQLKYSLENNFLQLDNITHQMPYDRQLSLKKFEHPYYSREGQASLKKNMMSNKLVEEVYLHYKESPFKLFSSNGTISVEGFLRKEIPNNVLGEKQLVTQFDSAIPTLLTAEKSLLDRHNPKFFYIVPLQSDDMTVYGSAIYSIKESSLIQMLDLTNSDGVSTNYLINEKNQILASTGNNELRDYLSSSKQIADLMKKDHFQFKNQKYLTQVLHNEGLQLTFVSVTNPAKALAIVNQVQTRFILIFLGILLVGLVVVSLIGLYSYRPVQKIKRLVDSYNQNGTSVNSMGDVHESIVQFLNEQQELHEEIRLQTPHAREQVLRKLLSDRFKSEKDLKLLLHSVHVNLPGENYFVMIIDEKTARDTLSKDFSLMDYLENVKGNGYTAYATEILSSEVIALLISYDPQMTQKKVVQEISKLLRRSLVTLPTMGVGSIVHRLTAFNVSYIDGLAALDYSRNDKKLVYYTEISSVEYSSTISYPDNKKLKLIQSLTQGDLDIAVETIQWLIKHGLEKPKSVTARRMYGFYILNTMAKTGGEIVGEPLLQMAEESAGFSTLQELETSLLDMAKIICQMVQNKPQNQESQLKRNLFEYIEENFMSSQLSLEMIATEFNLSVSYLSRFVKKESGLTFSKYIQELRLEKIKKSLVETDLPIKEIIRNCGYYDVSNYTRKFRTIVGVTPGQYRTINQEKGQLYKNN